MNHKLLRAALASYVLCSGAAGAAAQSSDAPVERPVVTAVRLAQGERIALDGRLSEPAWQRARPADAFKQSDPRFGAPATEGTEIRILFDRDALFIGVELFDSEATRLLGNQMLRDGALDGDDRFMWTLDPFFDQRSGYYFEINPAGAMGDAQLVLAPGNTFGTVQNRAWNGIWNAPPRPEDGKGIKGWFFKRFQKKAGGAVPSANRITLLRDADGDGVAETRAVLLRNLNSPFGMALVEDVLYVANSDALVRFPYSTGQTEITAAATKVVDLPGGPLNHHWTKGLIASPDGTRLCVSVGSNSNVAENGIEQEELRAVILEVNPQSGTHRVYASLQLLRVACRHARHAAAP